MSDTYKDKLKGIEGRITWKNWEHEIPNKRKTFEKKYHYTSHYHWLESTPHYWITEMMETPKRAQTRELLNIVMHLEDYEDSPEFPLAKKPHIYYW